MTGGVYIYVGVTQSGKTTKALADVRNDIRADGKPCLILDLGPAINFRGTYHEPDVRAVLTKLYGAKTHCCYTPPSRDDLDQLLEGIIRCGDCHVLVDEVRWVASHKSISETFTKALRHWAHGEEGPVTWRCTSQRPADLHRDFYACLTGELYAFRAAPGPDLERLTKECSFDPEVLASLPRGSFLTWSGRWEEAEGPPDPGSPGDRGPQEAAREPLPEASPRPGEPEKIENPVDSEPSAP